MSRHRRQQLRRARLLAERIHRAKLNSPATREMIKTFARIINETSIKPGEIDDAHGLFPGLSIERGSAT